MIEVESSEYPLDRQELQGCLMLNVDVKEMPREGGSYYNYYQIRLPIGSTEQVIEEAKEKALVEIADESRAKAMLEGKNYNGYQVSFTKDDGDGLVQVKAGFDMGLTQTVVHFKNGTKMPITVEDFPVFALWFVTERNKFFAE